MNAVSFTWLDCLRLLLYATWLALRGMRYCSALHSRGGKKLMKVIHLQLVVISMLSCEAAPLPAGGRLALQRNKRTNAHCSGIMTVELLPSPQRILWIPAAKRQGGLQQLAENGCDG